MRLLHVHVEGFRCLDALDFEPAPRVSLIRGRNAQGKTSVLEAILYTTTSKSQRTNTEQELAARGGEGFRTRVEAANETRNVALEAYWWRGAKRFRVNGVAQARVSDILGQIGVVLFTPDDAELVRGSGSVRRRFLDMELSQISPPYLAALQQYRQVLRQRNELLRHGKATDATLEPWDAQLASYGAALIGERRAFLDELRPFAERVYRAIAGESEALEVAYDPDVEDGASLHAVTEQHRPADLRRGQTNRGPHRDDIRITVGGMPARTHASQGQQKTAALALKLAEVELLHQRRRDYPVLMLDEVFAELDATRAQKLFDIIPREVQCVVTTTVLEGDRVDFGSDAESFIIEGGRLAPARSA